MSEFNLDTSGAVPLRHTTPDGQTFVSTLWPDLSPFEQGYVEAMFASMERGALGVPILRYPENSPCTVVVGFSDLAPETLAAIQKDCAAAENGWPGPTYHDGDGARFWRQRQAGGYPRTNPPLTLTLGDDGKVYQTVAG